MSWEVWQEQQGINRGWRQKRKCAESSRVFRVRRSWANFYYSVQELTMDKHILCFLIHIRPCCFVCLFFIWSCVIWNFFLFWGMFWVWSDMNSLFSLCRVWGNTCIKLSNKMFHLTQLLQQIFPFLLISHSSGPQRCWWFPGFSFSLNSKSPERKFFSLMDVTT